MKIKDRLALYFTLISVGILLIALSAILVVFTSFAKSDFYSRLVDRAHVAAQLYLEADEIPADSLSHVRERYLRQIPGEVVRFYNDVNTASFIRDRQQYWPNTTINKVRRNKEVEFSEGDRQTVGIYYNDNQGNFVILVSAVDVHGKNRIVDLVWIMLVMLVCVSAALFFIGRLFAKKALEPIDDVVEQMQLVRASNLSLRISEGNGRDEISKLAQNFNRLLKHLENAFDLQQTFVTNASHELRTPVTSIIGELEVTLHKQRSAEEYERVLRSVLAESERLDETISSLLELAQVDMSYTQAAMAPVALDELVWELADYWTARMGKGLFAVSVQHLPDDPERLSIPANRALLSIALNNIIGNAYKFSGNRRVQCNFYADNSRASITIIDSGIGIPAAEAEKVTTSFYRGSNAGSHPGSGIGLYITGKIISLFNGTLSIAPNSGGGTAVTVHFGV